MDGSTERNEAADPDRQADLARELCLRLLTVRSRTRTELNRALTRRGVPGEVAATVLDRLVEVGLVDDRAVAQLTLRAKMRRGYARSAVAVTLRERGVADADAAEVLADTDQDEEETAARAFAARRAGRLTNLDGATAARRLGGQLARRGYPTELIRRVVRDTIGPGERAPE